MSAAVEAGIEEFRYRFSLLDFDWNADFETMKLYSKNHLRSIENNLPQGSFKCKFSKLKEDIRE
jgi:5'-nucleotidase